MIIKKVIYELKTFRLNPLPKYVRIQIRVFQLAYPEYRAVILGFPWKDDDYINMERTEFEPIDKYKALELLLDLKAFAYEHGEEEDISDIIVEYPTIKYILHHDNYEISYASDEEYNEYYKEVYGDNA